MKQRTRLIAAGTICQQCGKKRAVILFRNRTWCLVDAINEVIALRGGLLPGGATRSA
jgi:hypothetical protein